MIADLQEFLKGHAEPILGRVQAEMEHAASELQFEKAAALRDEMYELRSLLAEDGSLKPWERIRLLAGEE